MSIIRAYIFDRPYNLVNIVTLEGEDLTALEAAELTAKIILEVDIKCTPSNSSYIDGTFGPEGRHLVVNAQYHLNTFDTNDK